METNTLERNAFGQDKVTRYGWKVVSERGEFCEVLKRDLHVNNDVYQRDATKPKVLELASNWSWIACGAIIVARRDGKLWVVDGQHRKLAADRRSDITGLPCLIFDVVDVASEARAFLATNRNRKPMTTLAAFRASIAAGDELAIFVRDIIAGSGLRLSTASSDAGDFKAVALALRLAARDRDAFVKVFELAARLALAARKPLHQRVLGGLAYIGDNIERGFSDPKLVKRIEQIGLAVLERAANSAAAYYASGGDRVYADGMMQAINKGLRTRFELSA